MWVEKSIEREGEYEIGKWYEESYFALLKMGSKIQERIEKIVRKILEESDMERMTEHKIRKQASAELNLNLSDPPSKAFVRYVVESFLEQQQQEELE